MVTKEEGLTRGMQLQQAGRLEEAEAHYHGLLQHVPQQVETLHALGLLLHQRGKHQEAIDFLSRCLAAGGPPPLVRSNLGAVCLAAGLLREAVTHCREAIHISPELAIAHYNLGAALFRLGELEEAEIALRDAVRLMPRDIVARCTLGSTLHQLRKMPEALALLQETARLAPTHPRAHHDLGTALLTAGQSERAVRHLREAVRLKPDFVAAHDNLGLGLRYLDQLDEAMACFREAVRLDPSYVRAHINLANSFESQGKFAEARAEFQEVRRHDPYNAQAIFGLSKLAAAGHFEFDDHDLQAIARRAAQPDLPPEDRPPLHFALGALFDRAGDYAQAFEHYRVGNQLRQELERRRGVVFDPTAHDQLVDRIIAVFTPAYFERVRSWGLDTELPVFVVGMMRSGTTLAEQILASHPLVHGAGELTDLEHLIAALPQRLGVTESYPEILERLTAEATGAVAHEYLQCLQKRGGAAHRVVDKLPRNLLNLGVIATLFPRARIIHCRRNAVDTCLSIFFQNFGGSIPYAWDLNHLGRYYRAYQRLMAHWARVLPMPIFELDYEQLTCQQETISRQLLAFCGLEWNERCLHFHETDRSVRTPSAFQVRQPLYRNAVGRWKHYESFLQPLFDALGGHGEARRS
ncbi:MAG TPA: sulfotransferase [Gemmataceae bacterium]|nr:sulfotransferase [Gemmataceae bacterium]